MAQTQLLVGAAKHSDVPTLAVFVTATKAYRNVLALNVASVTINEPKSH